MTFEEIPENLRTRLQPLGPPAEERDRLVFEPIPPIDPRPLPERDAEPLPAAAPTALEPGVTVAAPGASPGSALPPVESAPPTVAAAPVEASPAQVAPPAAFPPEAPVSSPPSYGLTPEPELDETPEMRALREQIEAAREELRTMISDPSRAGEDLAADPRVRELGQSLPRLQAELDALRKAHVPLREAHEPLREARD